MSANIFETLSFDPEEAASLRIRTRLMVAIREHLRHASLSQTAAAERIGCSQPRVSDIVNGKIEKFTIDFLVNAVTALGLTVDLTVTDNEFAA